MIDSRSTQPAVPPRILAPSSPRSINTSASSYTDVFDATPPPLPPKVPSRSNSPNSAQQPPLPARSFATSNSTPPLSPRGTWPINPAVAPLNTPQRSPPIPNRANLSDSGEVTRRRPLSSMLFLGLVLREPSTKDRLFKTSSQLLILMKMLFGPGAVLKI